MNEEYEEFDLQLSNQRVEEIKRIVSQIFINYNVHCTPISGFELATKMKIRLIPYSSFPSKIKDIMIKESPDGYCTKPFLPDHSTTIENYSKSIIFYNDCNIIYGRINNTIMHEIGHIVLQHSEDSKLAEKEVKFFAKYALVPPVLIHIKGLGNADIAQVAEEFNVSYQAAFYALQYYHKWLYHSQYGYTDYEQNIINLFKNAS